MRRLILLAAFIAQPVAAQVANPPSLVLPADLPTKADIDVAKSAADTAKATADAAAAVAAAACQPMAMVPPAEVVGGTTGSGQNCRLVNGANNRISRTGVFTYNATGDILCGGSTTCLWRDSSGNLAPLPAGAGSYPLFFTAIGTKGKPAVKCMVASTTNTGFTGATCVQSNLTIALAGSADVTVGLTPGQVFILSLPSTQASQ